MRVVTSTYRDAACLGWLGALPPDVEVTVYRKDDALREGEERVAPAREGEGVTVVDIPNFGRCDFAFLYHIWKHYDELDDVTVFAKANWAPHQEGDVLAEMAGCGAYDYCNLVRNFGPPHLQYWRPHDDQPPRYGHVEDVYASAHCFGAQCAQDWYREVFPGVEPPALVVGTGHGPCFSVSRRLVRRHPREVYARLMGKFLPDSPSWSYDCFRAAFATFQDAHVDVGKHFHDNMIRFYPVLFTHGAEGAFRFAA